MKVTIEHDGKKVEVELTAEQVKELGLQEEKKTGWERAESDKSYVYIDSYMQLTQTDDCKMIQDNTRYQRGNYFTDIDLAEKMLKRISLMLKMQRWADEHNEPLDWNDNNMFKYRINYNTNHRELRVSYDIVSRLVGAVYFSSYDIAEKAIEEFGDEIIDCYAESEVTRS